MQVEVLSNPDGTPRLDVTIHRAGTAKECAARCMYDARFADRPDYIRVDDSLLSPTQLLCRHPPCFKNERKGTTLQTLLDRRTTNA
jgi:hypothetical protein